MLKTLENTPSYVYLAVGAIGATATYLLYPSIGVQLTKHKDIDEYMKGLHHYYIL